MSASVIFQQSLIYSLALDPVNSTLLVLVQKSAHHSRRTVNLEKDRLGTYQVPTFSSPTSTTSPSLSQSCGFRPMPTPEGLMHPC